MYFPRSTGKVVGSTAGGAGGAAAAGGKATTKGPDKDPAGTKASEADASSGPGSAANTESEAAAHEPGVIEFVAQDSDGKPYAGAKYRVHVEKGRPIEGTLDAQGYAKVEGVGKGACVVSFPELNPG